MVVLSCAFVARLRMIEVGFVVGLLRGRVACIRGIVASFLIVVW